MVKYSNVIFEEGKKKFLPEVIKKEMPSSYLLVLAKIHKEKKVSTFDVETCDMIESEIPNPDYKEPSPRLKYALKRYRDYYTEWNWINYPKGPKSSQMDDMFEKWAGGKSAIYDWLEIVPFTPSIFITVCPPWTKKDKIRMNEVRTLHSGIKAYLTKCMNGAGYSKWKYVVECGSGGKHLHAHIWAQINPDMEKSMLRNGPKGKNSHIRKGKHQEMLRKYINESAPEGVLGGKWGVNSITSTICRNEELAKDKQLYLIESEKPADHKNLQGHSLDRFFKPIVFET